MTLQQVVRSVRAHSMPGGIHPAQHKAESNRTDIETLPLPSTLWLPLRMHAGQAAEPVVQVGDTVCKGQVLALAQPGVSANVHAPTSGRIVAIEPHSYAHESGLKELAICLEADGLDAWRQQTPWPDWQQKPLEELTNRIREAGIAGLGGAGFPADIKYRNKHQPTHTLLVNAVECEPYITADDRIMRERAREILQGARICQHLLSAKRILIGIEDNKPEAIDAIKQAALDTNIAIELCVVKTKYPSGGERQLIQLTTGLEVPSNGLPTDIGIVCQNVATLAQIYRAIVKDEPLISRVTTVTGKAVERPGNYEVLIGTSMETLLNHAGAHLKKADRVIMGGPMMGFAVPDVSAPVMKTTNCLLVPTKKELPAPVYDNPCIRCGLCEQACPVNLLPQQMYWAAKHRQLESAELHDINDCIECGACAYVCPSRIPLVHYYRFAKGEIRQEKEDQEKAERARIRFEHRQARLEKEQAEKEARRKARAEAAAKAQAEKKKMAASSDSEDPIKAAVERAAAKKSTHSDSTQKSLAELEAELARAKNKFDSASQRLREAEENQPEMVAALRKAADKLEEKYLSAQKHLAQAQSGSEQA